MRDRIQKNRKSLSLWCGTASVLNSKVLGQFSLIHIENKLKNTYEKGDKI